MRATSVGIFVLVLLLVTNGCGRTKEVRAQAKANPRSEQVRIDRPELVGEWDRSFEDNYFEAKEFFGRLTSNEFANLDGSEIDPSGDFPAFGEEIAFSKTENDCQYIARVQWGYRRGDSPCAFSVVAIADKTEEELAIDVDTSLLTIALPDLELESGNYPKLVNAALDRLARKPWENDSKRYFDEPIKIGVDAGAYFITVGAQSNIIDGNQKAMVVVSAVFMPSLALRSLTPNQSP